MKREEITENLLVLREWLIKGFGKEMPQEYHDTLTQAHDMLSVNLPSELDEAAETYTENILANGEDMFDAIADGFRAGAEWKAGQGWHDVTETPSIFGFYLVIHEKGWCVANYMGKGIFCESGWVEAIHHIEIEHPRKWLDLRDLIPKKQ